MKELLVSTGVINALIGAFWWWRDSPSAERPASLLIIVGIIGISAVWWLP